MKLRPIRLTCRGLLIIICLGFASMATAQANEIRIMAWNLEHLNESNDVGCVPRTNEDYEEIVANVNAINPDVVAFQEVETAQAAARVFNEDDWTIVFSSRPNTGPGNECRQLEGKHLRHLGTGFALRKGIEYVRNPDLDTIGLDNDFLRWGTDITLMHDGEKAVRLLSIHLRSGCWGPPQDAQPAIACPDLRAQSTLLTAWVDEREKGDVPYIVLGDFNRRLALPDDWMWSELNSNLQSPLHLLDQGIKAKCDPRYIDFIDHLVLDSRAINMYREGSFAEIPRTSEHPDHCAIVADFTL